MKKAIKYLDYPEMACYLTSWFPFFGQGLCLGRIAFVKYVYYKDTTVICLEETNDVIKHEYSHFILNKTKYKSWFKFILAYLGWRLMLWFFPHSKFPFEVEANKIKATL